MNKLRVFQNVNKRRKPYIYGLLLLFFLFFPYLITKLFSNAGKSRQDMEIRMMLEQLKEGSYTVINETGAGRESIPLEMYVADKLMRVMENGYEAEALKAQAVLLRTELISEAGTSVTVSDEFYGRAELEKAYLTAVMQTKGIYLEYDGKPVYGAYCKVSNGSTRSAAELLETGEYPYLAGAVCDRDFLSGEFAGTLIIDEKEFAKKYEMVSDAAPSEEVLKTAGENGRYEEQEGMVLLRDSAGYVLFFQYEGKWVSGEQLRYALNLPSASFQVQRDGEAIVFHTKGSGHGLGLSQFGANEMALQGKDFIEILEYFFQGITFNKIE